jgi:AraC-like DNA-binding protein
MRGRFSWRIEGTGAVFGIKFRPGGFYPFAGFPVAGIMDTSLPIETILPIDAAAVEKRLLDCDDDNEMIDIAQGIFRERLPEPDENVELVNRIVAAIIEDRSILRVEDLAGRTGMSKRSLQRLFNRYVGASPKWVIARYRLFEAAEILAGGNSVDLGKVAVNLGYFDQAHFIKDFKRIVGSPPARYARGSTRRET